MIIRGSQLPVKLDTYRGVSQAFFTPYNQVPSMWIPQAEVANVITGMLHELAGEDR